MTSIDIAKFSLQINVRNGNMPGFCYCWWLYSSTSKILLSGLKKLSGFPQYCQNFMLQNI